MANVLTDLAGDIYKAVDVVGRELTGTIAGSTINSNGSERVAVGDTVRSSFTRPAQEVDVAPSMTIPEGTDQTVDNKTATITKSKAVQIPWTGEDIRSVNNGMGYETIYGDQLAQAMRRLANLVEIDANYELARNASRAVGTAGTTPFGANQNVINEARQILVDNGAPNDGRMSLVMNTTAGTAFRNLSNLYKVNEAGSDSLLRQGILQDISGILMRETGQPYQHVAGTGSGYLVNGALAIDATSIVSDTGSGTILAGDVVTFAGDARKYVVGTALSGGTFILNETGLRTGIANNASISLGAGYSSNVLFHQAAHEIIMRPPAVPNGSDAAIDSMTVQDPFSGLVFDVRVYVGYRKTMVEVALAWGVKAWMPKYIAQVLG
tara:strand:+ start:17474 stop:18613 length:1140 start_codon:yes stop_codon:yes gene_type:complete